MPRRTWCECRVKQIRHTRPHCILPLIFLFWEFSFAAKGNVTKMNKFPFSCVALDLPALKFWGRKKASKWQIFLTDSIVNGLMRVVEAHQSFMVVFLVKVVNFNWAYCSVFKLN